MFHLMRNDLEKYKKVYELSKELETMYSPFTPQNQYSEATLNNLPKKHDIIDLTQFFLELSGLGLVLVQVILKQY